MRTHPPAFVQAIASRLRLFFARRFKLKCAPNTLPQCSCIAFAPLRDSPASSCVISVAPSCVRLSSVSCAVPGIVRHCVRRRPHASSFSASRIVRATSLRRVGRSRYRAPSCAMAPPCFSFFSVACARTACAACAVPGIMHHCVRRRPQLLLLQRRPSQRKPSSFIFAPTGNHP